MINKRHLNKIIDRAVAASFENGELKMIAVNRLVKDFKTMHLSDAIYTLSNYVKGLKRTLNEYTMTVESVVPLSLGQMLSIQKKLRRLFSITNTRATINPSLLGGIRIRVGDTVLDYSIRSKLNQIKDAIISGA